MNSCSMKHTTPTNTFVYHSTSLTFVCNSTIDKSIAEYSSEAAAAAAMKFSNIAVAAATAILSSAGKTVATQDVQDGTRRLRTTKLYTSSSSSSSTQRDVEFGREAAVDPYLGLPDARPRSFHRRAQAVEQTADGEVLVVGSMSAPIVNLPDLSGGFSVPIDVPPMIGGPDIGGPDENGCIPGEAWCPETQACVSPWEATCPIDGQTFEGGTELVCLDGRCSAPLDDECLWSDGGAQFGSFYLTGLNGPYEVPSTCTLTCTGCEPKVADDSCPFCVDGVTRPDLVLDANTGTTCNQAKLVTLGPGITPELCSQIQLAEMLCCPSDPPLIGGLDENGCNSSSVWCPETQTCIQTWMETCPIQDGETFEGGTELSCVDGRCSAPADDKCSYEDGSAQYAGFYFPDLNGPFEVPINCTLNCTGCEPTVASTTTAPPTSSSTSMIGGLDEYGCGGGTGTDWCPELQECIQPWAQTCPIEDGETFEGGTELTCVDGRCSAPLDDECLWSNEDNTTQFGAFYLTGLNGPYVVPSTCTLNCTGCEPKVAATTTAATTTAAPDEASTTTTTEATTFNLNPMPSATPPPTAFPTNDMNFEPIEGGAPSSGMMMKSSVVVATFVGVVAGVVALM